MRCPLLLSLLLACSGGAPTANVESAVPPARGRSLRSCRDAALGLEGATRGVRDPERDVAGPLRARCAEDAWPASAIDCFATMQEGDLGRCSGYLPEAARAAMFDVLGEGDADPAGLMIARARLEHLVVDAPACARFVAAVSAALTCERMPVATRVQLGRETVELLSLPSARFDDEQRQQVASMCEDSLGALLRHAATLGCDVGA